MAKLTSARCISTPDLSVSFTILFSYRLLIMCCTAAQVVLKNCIDEHVELDVQAMMWTTRSKCSLINRDSGKHNGAKDMAPVVLPVISCSRLCGFCLLRAERRVCSVADAFWLSAPLPADRLIRAVVHPPERLQWKLSHVSAIAQSCADCTSFTADTCDEHFPFWSFSVFLRLKLFSL